MDINGKKYPNIVLITADSLRADHCSFMGYRRNTTPFLSKLAKKAIVFKHAYANGPHTPATIPALLTGTLSLYKGSYLVGDRKILPEYFKELKFKTIASGFNGYISYVLKEKAFLWDFSSFNLDHQESLTKSIIRAFLDLFRNPHSTIEKIAFLYRLKIYTAYIASHVKNNTLSRTLLAAYNIPFKFLTSSKAVIPPQTTFPGELTNEYALEGIKSFSHDKTPIFL